MSLRDLDPLTRQRLRRHAWLPTLWCVSDQWRARRLQLRRGRCPAADPGPALLAWLGIVGRTWLAGIAFVVASAAAGWLLMKANPGGASLADLWR